VRRKCLWAFVYSYMAVCASAQDPQKAELRGSLRSDVEVMFHGYMVEVSSVVQHQSWKADVMSDGTFALRDVPPGDYVLRVTTYQGAVLKEEFVSMHGVSSNVDVILPKQERAAPGGPVSLRQLQNPPAAKAIRLAAAGQRFAHDGEDRKAVEDLQKAIQISPDFAAAHSNLAVEYIKLKQYPAARHEIQKALSIAGPNAVDLCNLAFIDTAENRIPQAIDEVKAALREDPNNPNGHYILGTLLLLDRRTAAEGVQHLEQAAPNVAGARQMLAHLRGQ